MSRARWHTQQLLRSIGMPGWVGAAVLLACAALWVGVSAPLSEDTARLGADSTVLAERLAARATAAPSDATPQQQLDAFASRFPGQKGIAQALTRLHEISRKRGVQIEQAEFKFVSEASEPVSRYTIVLPVKGEYRALRRFNRDALRELPGLALEEISVRRSDTKSPMLESQLRFVLFVAKTG